MKSNAAHQSIAAIEIARPLMNKHQITRLHVQMVPAFLLSRILQIAALGWPNIRVILIDLDKRKVLVVLNLELLPHVLDITTRQDRALLDHQTVQRMCIAGNIREVGRNVLDFQIESHIRLVGTVLLSP